MNTAMNKEQEILKLIDIYDKLGWVDFFLTVLEVLYMGQLIQGIIKIYGDVYFLENMFVLIPTYATILGVSLAVAFNFISIFNISLTIKLRKLGHLGIIRTSIRLLWNSAWFLLNIWFLALFLFAL